MIKEYSFGIIPLRQQGNEWEVLLIQHHSGHWAFPKGHAEKGELPKQAAERELNEETGLTISHYLTEKSLTEDYFFFFKNQRVHKTVQYFLAKVIGSVHIQEAEIRDSQWVSVQKAADFVTFKETKSLCFKVQQFIIVISESLRND